MKIFYYLLILTILHSCQSVEVVENVVFDYEQFPKLTFLANSIEINNKYKPTYDDSFVDLATFATVLAMRISESL